MLVVAFTCLFSYNVSFATAAVSAKETRETILKKVATGDADALLDQFTKSKTGKKAEKWMKKISKKFDGAKLDFNSEPDKWLKYCLIAAAVSFVLSVAGIFVSLVGLIAWLFWLCAVVLFFYWLFLRLEII